ncbi:MAG: M6 family metalloprotease domain-containing protein, partial [Candidatus Nanoarchaeia archaeon]
MKTQSLPNLFNRVVLKITIFAIIIFLCKIVGAVPACPEPAEVEQPDGKKIKIKLHGDEFFSWHEDEEGYAIKQKANGAWFYARPSKDKADFEIIEDAPVGSVDPKALGLKKHDLPPQHLIKERISKQLEQISPSNLKKDGKTKEKETESDTLPASNESNSAPSNGSSAEEIPPPTDGGTAPPLSASPFQPNLKCVVILAAFNDHWDTENNTVLSTRGKIRDNYDTLFNTSGTTIDGAVGSVNDYYNQISYGKTNIQFIVSDWVKLDYDESYYGDNANEWTGENRVKLLASHAVAKADAAGFDFSQGDGDGDGWVDLLVIVHSGYSESVSSNPSTCIWPRTWAMANDVTCDGKKMYRFCIVSAMSGLQSSSTYMMRIGTVVHEMGHLFGLKDVYDVGNATKGVGTWCLMAFGSWGAFGNVSSEMRPVHMCAFSKMILGYIDPTPVQTKTGISLARLSSSPVAHILRSSASADEYFLVENRGSDSTSNFDYNLPKGILITHVDTKVYNVMNHSVQWPHPALRVEEANGGNTLATNAVANANHVWTSSNGLSGGFRDTTGNVYTNAMTYQSSHQYQRTDNSANYTGITASNFSSVSATMTYDLQTRVPTVNSATVYSSSYNVSWTASAGASIYELQEGTSTTATSFTDNAESLADMRANWQNLGA